MSEALVLQAPAAPGALFLLFHGVGASQHDLAPLGERLAREFPDAAVVSVPAPDASDLGRGLQWFSVLGVTESNRAARVAATLPRFVETVRHWQQRMRVTPAATTLVGFSQGAIMALEAAHAQPPVAARVVSLSGRYSTLPQAAPAARMHFLHGAADPVIPAANAQAGVRRLQELNADVTLDVVPALGHGIDRTAQDLLVQRLRQP
jgi:phospholipase/carboxylesterase